jgi:hypothetical protein
MSIFVLFHFFICHITALNDGGEKAVNFTLAPGSVASDLRQIANTTVMTNERLHPSHDEFSLDSLSLSL